VKADRLRHDDEGLTVSYLSDGEPVAARLYGHANSTGLPALVVSPSRVTTIVEMSWLAKPLHARGYTVLVQGYRRATTRYQIRDVIDVRHAITFLQEHMACKAAAIGLVGHSRGASASLRAAACDTRVKLTVALSPPIDIARYMLALRAHSPSRYDMLTRAYGGEPSDEPRYYQEISPLHHAAQIVTPVLLVHGTDDMVAPKEHSEWMIAALISSGNKRSRVELIDGVGHFFERRFIGYDFERVVTIIEKWLATALCQA
jgi:dipeptidyl aminopeptidase/acylaminoacyl peptidase